MTNDATDVRATRASAATPLTPGEALVELFLANADRGSNADNDLFVEELVKRRRAIRALANPGEPGSTTTAS
ncbi:MAG: hypothetical protein ACRDTX_05590 [Pseudonocardiaceae bacterium]